VLAAVAIIFVSAGWAVGKTVYEPDLEPIAAGAAPADDGPLTSTTAEPVVTTTTEPEVTHPSADDPLRVVLAGDSVMAGLVPALESALEGGGETEVRFVLTPAILREPGVRYSWQKELEQFNPELIVMFVGIWELGQIRDRTGETVDPTEQGWRQAYDNEVLDPWLEFITQAGAQVVWIGTPAIDNDDTNVSFSLLNDAWRTAADRWGPVTYVDAGATLGRPEDGFFSFLRDDSGRRVRARQVDGLHLCPAGAEALAGDVLTVISELAGVPVAEGWADGDWQDDLAAYPAANCP
jgi:hypothetical protein